MAPPGVGRCRLRLLYKQKGITQTDLSTKTNIPVKTLSKYANNVNVMTLSRAKEIADALHCTVEELYTWD